MDTKKTIRKVLFAGIWLVIGGGLLTLLVAAIGKKNKDICKDIDISIRANSGRSFIQKSDLLQLMNATTHGKITGKSLSKVDLHLLEASLEKNVWIENAQLYFDNKNVLHVAVDERDPIARVFSTDNRSFYVDNFLKKLPLSDLAIAKVPVFTGYPEKISKQKDSVLLSQVRDIAEFILNNSFWMSQVAQININDGQKFEMIPVVGNHIVELGDGSDIEAKFGRLMTFYKEVLSKTGFNKYATIDVQFARQVVAAKGKPMTKVDSVQLRKNVEKLMQKAQQMHSDTIFTTDMTIEKPLMTKDEPEDTKPVSDTKKEKTIKPAPVKTTLKSGSDEKQKKPRAVMPEKD